MKSHARVVVIGGGVVGVSTLYHLARKGWSDVVLVEHYPFSKWALAGEIEATIAAARHANAAVRVVCSVRDFPLQTRHEACDAPTWRSRVIDTLHRHFDAVLHHADPALLAFDSVFPDAGRLRIPVHATVAVSEGGAAVSGGGVAVSTAASFVDVATGS